MSCIDCNLDKATKQSFVRRKKLNLLKLQARCSKKKNTAGEIDAAILIKVSPLTHAC